MYNNIMKFEWDSNKNNSNKSKHGIDFETSEKLWIDENRIEIIAPYPLEDRRIMIGTIEGIIWTAIYTIRCDVIRIISVRRARKKEVSLYEKEVSG